MLPAEELDPRPEPTNAASILGDVDGWAFVFRHVLPRVARIAAGAPQLRVWSSGCKTGEDAYSIALLLVAEMGEADYLRRARVFATDPDGRALVHARRARYAIDRLAAVPSEWRHRYFVRDGDSGRVGQNLRQSIVFGRHRLAVDPPLSHMHFLSCRDTLVHMSGATQVLALARLHFALETGGVLLLGAADPVPASTSFAKLDPAHPAYVKLPVF
jgi:two-component system CheB/CheR fusion protein